MLCAFEHLASVTVGFFIDTAGVNAGNGLVSITLIQAATTSVPEPSTLALLGVVVLAAGACRLIQARVIHA